MITHFPKFHMKDPEGGGGGGGGEDWRTGLPESVQGWDEVKNADTPEKFWEQMANQRSFLGQSIRIPSEDAGDTTWSEFHTKLQEKVPGLLATPDLENTETLQGFFKKLGKPDKPEDYVMPEIDAKGIKLDKAPAEALRQIALDHNLTQKQFEGLVKDMTDNNVNAAVETKTEHLKQKQALADEWGLAYDTRLKGIQALIAQTGAPTALKAAVDADQLDPSSMRWLHGIVEKFGGGEGLNLNQDHSNTGVMTPDEAKAKIGDMMNNREHAYWNVRHPQHNEALQEMLNLQKLSNPDASTDLNDLRSGAVSNELADILNKSTAVG